MKLKDLLESATELVLTFKTNTYVLTDQDVESAHEDRDEYADQLDDFYWANSDNGELLYGEIARHFELLMKNVAGQYIFIKAGTKIHVPMPKPNSLPEININHMSIGILTIYDLVTTGTVSIDNDPVDIMNIFLTNDKVIKGYPNIYTPFIKVFFTGKTVLMNKWLRYADNIRAL